MCMLPCRADDDRASDQASLKPDGVSAVVLSSVLLFQRCSCPTRLSLLRRAALASLFAPLLPVKEVKVMLHIMTTADKNSSTLYIQNYNHKRNLRES